MLLNGLKVLPLRASMNNVFGPIRTSPSRMLVFAYFLVFIAGNGYWAFPARAYSVRCWFVNAAKHFRCPSWIFHNSPPGLVKCSPIYMRTAKPFSVAKCIAASRVWKHGNFHSLIFPPESRKARLPITAAFDAGIAVNKAVGTLPR